MASVHPAPAEMGNCGQPGMRCGASDEGLGAGRHHALPAGWCSKMGTLARLGFDLTTKVSQHTWEEGAQSSKCTPTNAYPPVRQ